MRNIKHQASLGALALSALLVGCGSGGGDDDRNNNPMPPPTSSTDVPASALESTSGLVAFVRELIGQTSDTSEPVRIGDVKLPVDDTAEPVPVSN